MSQSEANAGPKLVVMGNGAAEPDRPAPGLPSGSVKKVVTPMAKLTYPAGTQALPVPQIPGVEPKYLITIYSVGFVRRRDLSVAFPMPDTKID